MSTAATAVIPTFRKLASGAAQLAGGQVIRRGLRMLTMFVAARWLGPAQFGIYVLLVAMTEMLALITGGGYLDYLTREAVQLPQSAGWIATRLSLVRFAYTAAGAILILGGLRLLHYDGRIIAFAAVMIGSLYPRTILECSYGLARGSQHFAKVPLLEGIHAGTLFLVAVALLWKGWGLASVVAAELISCALAAVIGVVLTRSAWERRVHTGWDIRELFQRTIAFNVFPFIVNAYDRADVFVLSKLASTAAVGIYGLSYRIFAGVGIVPYGIMGAILPVLSESAWNRDKEQLCSTAMRLMYSIALLAILAVMLLANPLVPALLGHAYGDSATVLQILIWSTIPIYLNYTLNATLLSSGNERIFILTALVCMIFNLAANIVLVPRYSYFAAAAVTIATECVLLGQNLFFVARKLGQIPLPKRVAGLTLSFGLILAFGMVADRLGAPRIPVGIVGLGLFIAYVMVDNPYRLVGFRQIAASKAQ